MRALVVYESMYGNTERVASAIADGLRRSMEVELLEVGQAAAGAPPDADLVVVGGPTHAHGLSREKTRASAAADAGEAEPVSRDKGVRDWIAWLPPHPGGRFAAFDTRFAKPRWLTGSAAHGIAARMQRKGYRPAAPPESFFVTHGKGPLDPGEIERAADWGATLASAVAGPIAA